MFELVHLHKFTYLYSSGSPTLIAVEDSNIIILFLKVNLETEINTTKETSENVAQLGIKPRSPGYRSDALKCP